MAYYEQAVNLASHITELVKPHASNRCFGSCSITISSVLMSIYQSWSSWKSAAICWSSCSVVLIKPTVLLLAVEPTFHAATDVCSPHQGNSVLLTSNREHVPENIKVVNSLLIGITCNVSAAYAWQMFMTKGLDNIKNLWAYSWLSIAINALNINSLWALWLTDFLFFAGQ